MQTIDQTLTSDTGLPGRAWFKNLVYAPGRLPAMAPKPCRAFAKHRAERFGDAVTYIKLTADALNAYSDRLDAATAVVNGG